MKNSEEEIRHTKNFEKRAKNFVIGKDFIMTFHRVLSNMSHKFYCAVNHYHVRSF